MKGVMLLATLAVCLICDVTAQGLDQEWIDDINAQADAVALILDDLLVGPGKGEAYVRLADLVDTFGNRHTGSDSLEQSIDYTMARLIAEGFQNVHVEDVTVPRWVRGPESARMLAPREANLGILGLMFSITGNVTAEAMVVRDFDELYRRQDEVPGKIVVYNQEVTDYARDVVYRTDGATRAASLGAVGALIRSIADYSLYTPHTGAQNWWANVTRIPSGCITIEDAQMLNRMHDNQETILINIEANHVTRTDGVSRNLIAEIPGSEFPEEVVMFGGHIDSWDVGVGAMDDGGGVMITRQILTTVARLGLTPRRTLRLVLWTAEEIGIIGGHAYWDAHQDELANMVLVMESDIGSFSPLGLHLHNMTALTVQIMQQILDTYLADIGANHTIFGGPGTADIDDWIHHGVPGASTYTENQDYFHFHHTEADRMTVEDPDELDRCSCVFTVTAYVVANMQQRLPSRNDPPSNAPLHHSNTPPRHNNAALRHSNIQPQHTAVKHDPPKKNQRHQSNTPIKPVVVKDDSHGNTPFHHSNTPIKPAVYKNDPANDPPPHPSEHSPRFAHKKPKSQWRKRPL